MLCELPLPCFYVVARVIVYTKMKNSVIIYSPSGCSSSFFILLNTKEDILKMLVNKQLTIAIEVNGYR